MLAVYAFPRPLPKGEWHPDDVLAMIEEHAGMTLRDYFAAAALSARPIQISSHEPAAKLHGGYGLPDRRRDAKGAQCLTATYPP